MLVKVTIGLIVLLLAPMALAQDNSACFDCHADSDLTGLDRLGNEISMFVGEMTVDSSVHAGMDCVDCHADLQGFDDYPHEDELAPVDCSSCHDEIAKVFNASGHVVKDNVKSPTCASCHGKHLILSHSNDAAMTSPSNLPHTCSACHSELSLKGDSDVHVADAVNRYLGGIHAAGIARGIGSAASCNDCHGVHDLYQATDSRSRVNKMRVPQTCAKCHNDIYIQYSRGIHGKALAAGILDSPNCVDCHGEHRILALDDVNSPVNGANLSDFVCSRCHNDPRMLDKYDMGKGKFSSYQDSYHGLAMRGGSVKAANCASCHKAHDILPETNPASSIHENNLVATCQKCHPEANIEFAHSYTHSSVASESNEWDTLVRQAYIILIIVVIGGMILHNLIITWRYVLRRFRAVKKVKTVQRFTGNMIFQHMVLFISFTVLVITGFALRYPEQWWVGMLSAVGLTEVARSVIHRTAAVLMLYVSVHHTFFMAFSQRGRKEFMAMLPVKQDITDVFANMKYHIGLSNDPPNFAQYDYTEKAEYWALVWGTLVMAGTGFILWFPTFFTGFLPGWSIKIAETIHLYEAWLATLAIVFFHFFFVIFHPDRYPMSFTWIDGKITEHNCEHHHPAWFEELKREEAEAGEAKEDDKPKKISDRWDT